MSLGMNQLLHMILGISLAALVAGTADAQQKQNWDRSPGKVHKGPVPAQASKYAAVQDVLNRSSFLQSPEGYDVMEAALADLDEKSGIYKGSLVIGLPLFFREPNGALSRQAEYEHVVVAFNNPTALLALNAGVYRQETEKLGLPLFFTAKDTLAYLVSITDGVRVGKGVDRPGNDAFGHHFFVLNPSGRSVFVPVPEEKYIRLCIGKWRMDEEEEMRKLAENEGYLRKMASDKNQQRFISEYQEAGKRMQERIDLDESRLKAAEQKLGLMTAKVRNAPAIDDEALTGFKTLQPQALYMFNPDFYDRTLPKSAIQLMVIWDPATLAGIRFRESDAFMEKNFFDKLDFKALSDLMNK
ncbi:MAG: hypothetical protein C5B59_12660 [Bacteroidetes bacterium]|nr:MAG: hypothetical protein C5B59_12660 [Bacteroidota bacterium]